MKRINLNIYNTDQVYYPSVMTGLNSVIVGTSFLDAPIGKIVINGVIPPTTPIQNVSVDIASVSASRNIIPVLPKNPCDGSSQSTLNVKRVASYVPAESSQVPYSVLGKASVQNSVSSTEVTTPLVLAALNNSVECK